MSVAAAQRCFGHIAAWSQRFSILIVLSAIVASALALGYTKNHLGINTDTGDLFSNDLQWRKTYRRYTNAFPMYSDNLIVVVDAQSSETADFATAALEDALQAEETTIEWVYYPRGGDFFSRNALLFLELDELEDLIDKLSAMQPFLGSLAKDPSAAELFHITAKALKNREQIENEQLSRMLSHLDQAIEASLDGRKHPLSWQEIMLDQASSVNEKRRVLIVKPKLSYDALLPAGPAMDRIRELALALDIVPANGLSVRITGSLAMSVEELDSVSRGAARATLIVIFIVSVVLVGGLRSLKLTLASVLTLLVGLSFTAAFAAATIGHLNLISVAFAVLYVGLGIDFAIHLALRHRELMESGEPHRGALTHAVADVGTTLLVCAVTTGIGFFAFTVTDFTGVSELGIISGTGMFISLGLSVTLMPALLTLLPLRSGVSGGPNRTASVQRSSARSAKPVLIGASLLLLIALGLIPSINFDRNPLNVREADSESVSTFRDLMKHSQTPPWTIIVLAQNQEVTSIKERVEKLTLVDSVISIEDFVPDDQEDKLFLIDELSLLLGNTLDLAPLPDEADWGRTRSTLNELLTSIESQIELAQDPVLGEPIRRLHANAKRLAKRLEQSQSNPITHLEYNLVGLLGPTLLKIDQALQTEGVDFEDLPPKLKRRWVTPDKDYRVEIIPAQYMQEPAAMRQFVNAVKAVVPDATASPVTLLESGDSVVRAFQQAMLTAVVLIAALLYLLLRDVRDVALILGPLVLAACYTVASMVILGIPFNFANVITLPLLLGIGVDNGIHMVRRWRAEPSQINEILRTSTARAVVVSALTTICSFGNLAFSPHPGTASMGQVLTIGLAFNLICTLVILPSLLKWRAATNR